MKTKQQRSVDTSALKLTLVVTLVLVLLGRGVTYLNTVTATNIVYASWVSTALSYLAELLVCARTVVAIAGICSAVYAGGGVGHFFGVAAFGALLDYAARFLIDVLTNAIVGAELIAACWLFLQLLFELLFFAAAYLISNALRRKQEGAPTVLQARRYTAERSCAYSLLIGMAARLVLEVWYLVDFMLAYSDITATEVASIVGSFLKVIVIYGGFALLLGGQLSRRKRQA